MCSHYEIFYVKMRLFYLEKMFVRREKIWFK